MHNGDFWRDVFTDTYVGEVRAFHDGVLRRVLPAFDGLEAEADAVVAAEYVRVGQWPDAAARWDDADAAELALRRGIEHYERMLGVRQGMLNLSTAGLFHLVEQQVSMVLRRELLSADEERDPMVLKRVLAPDRLVPEFEARLRQSGIDPAVPSARGLRRLQLVANVVKHGLGPSAEALHADAPALFIPPALRTSDTVVPTRPAGPTNAGPRMPAERPVLGRDLYVTTDEFAAFARDVESYWWELADAVAGTEPPDPTTR